MKKVSLALKLGLFLVLLCSLVPVTVLAQGEVACETDVVTQAEDSVSKFADKFYGDATAYTAIVEATNAKAATDSSYATITDPNVVSAGLKLCIPSVADAEATLKKSVPASTFAKPGSD